MPAHSGVWLYEYPCRGNQMPCSQMIEHELQATTRHGHREPGDVAGGEGADPEQAELEQRIGHPRLDHHERAQQEGAADEERVDGRARPALG